MSQIDYAYDEDLPAGQTNTGDDNHVPRGSVIDHPDSGYENHTTGMNDIEGEAVPPGKGIDSPVDNIDM